LGRSSRSPGRDGREVSKKRKKRGAVEVPKKSLEMLFFRFASRKPGTQKGDIWGKGLLTVPDR